MSVSYVFDRFCEIHRSTRRRKSFEEFYAPPEMRMGRLSRTVICHKCLWERKNILDTTFRRPYYLFGGHKINCFFYVSWDKHLFYCGGF